MYTKITAHEAGGALSVLAAVSDDTGDVNVAISTLTVATGHSDLQANADALVFERYLRRVEELCEVELGRGDVGENTSRFRCCALIDLQSRVPQPLRERVETLSERYRLLIPGQEPKK
jgi:hypothetical protein